MWSTSCDFKIVYEKHVLRFWFLTSEAIFLMKVFSRLSIDKHSEHSYLEHIRPKRDSPTCISQRKSSSLVFWARPWCGGPYYFNNDTVRETDYYRMLEPYVRSKAVNSHKMWFPAEWSSSLRFSRHLLSFGWQALILMDGKICSITLIRKKSPDEALWTFSIADWYKSNVWDFYA